MSTIIIGEQTVLELDDGGHGDVLIAQLATLSQTATVISMSIFVNTVSGSLRLGIYDDLAGVPNNLVTQSAAFVVSAGLNTQSVTQVQMVAGTYWLAFLPSDGTQSIPATNNSGTRIFTGFSFGPLPSPFPGPSPSSVKHWTLFATLDTNPSIIIPVQNTTIPIMRGFNM